MLCSLSLRLRGGDLTLSCSTVEIIKAPTVSCYLAYLYIQLMSLTSPALPALPAETCDVEVKGGKQRKKKRKKTQVCMSVTLTLTLLTSPRVTSMHVRHADKVISSVTAPQTSSSHVTYSLTGSVTDGLVGGPQ